MSDIQHPVHLSSQQTAKLCRLSASAHNALFSSVDFAHSLELPDIIWCFEKRDVITLTTGDIAFIDKFKTQGFICVNNELFKVEGNCR